VSGPSAITGTNHVAGASAITGTNHSKDPRCEAEVSALDPSC
jgi:hypothetical protein